MPNSLTRKDTPLAALNTQRKENTNEERKHSLWWAFDSLGLTSRTSKLQLYLKSFYTFSATREYLAARTTKVYNKIAGWA